MDIVPAAPDAHQTPAAPGSPPKQYSYLPPDFINLSLPNSRFSGDTWIRQNGNLTLTIAAVHPIGPNDDDKFIPYGKYARAALLFLCTEAVRTQKSVIPISESYRGFMKQLGLGYSRDSAIEAARQMQALAASSITVTVKVTHDDGEIEKTHKRYYISTKDNIAFTAEHSGELSEKRKSSIELSPDFMQMLSTSRVPVRADVWMHLLRTSRAAMTLDIYVWLAYRLHHVKQPVHVSWEQLHQQFGSDVELKGFTRKFRKALAEVLKVYPEAKVPEFGETARGGTHGILLCLSKNALDSAWAAPLDDDSSPES